MIGRIFYWGIFKRYRDELANQAHHQGFGHGYQQARGTDINAVRQEWVMLIRGRATYKPETLSFEIAAEAYESAVAQMYEVKRPQ